MPQKIEQLYLLSLKIAFREYLREQLIPEDKLKEEWEKFWRKLEKKCSVINTL